MMDDSVMIIPYIWYEAKEKLKGIGNKLVKCYHLKDSESVSKYSSSGDGRQI
jgi:hypothetical protein